MATAELSPSGPIAPAKPQLSLHPPVGGKSGLGVGGTKKEAQKIEMAASPWESTAPEIKKLLENAMKLYTEKDPDSFHEALKQFAFNAEFDGPTYFFRGTERAKIFNYGFSHLFSRVEVEPKVVRVTMLSDRLGLIELDAVLKLYPRQLLPRVWPITALYPEVLPLHGTWSLVAKGDDDKVVSWKERIHNLPTLPQLPRALASTAVTTGAMSLTLWP